MVVLLSLCATLIAACDRKETPQVTLDTHRAATAARSFTQALAKARAWRKDAQWYGIVPFTSMERAFALPLDDASPSWFFRFGSAEGKSEYVVEVRDEKVLGANEFTLPDYIEPPLAELEPLGNKWTMMDNGALLEKYAEEEGSLLAQYPDMSLDYRLAQPKGQAHPVWTLINAKNLSKAILVVDAVTAEILPVE